jgi:hypothetical protein
MTPLTPLVSGVNDTADQTIFRQQLSYANFVKKLAADEQRWAVSMKPLTSVGRCH